MAVTSYPSFSSNCSTASSAWADSSGIFSRVTPPSRAPATAKLAAELQSESRYRVVAAYFWLPGMRYVIFSGNADSAIISIPNLRSTLRVSSIYGRLVGFVIVRVESSGNSGSIIRKPDTIWELSFPENSILLFIFPIIPSCPPAGVCGTDTLNGKWPPLLLQVAPAASSAVMDSPKLRLRMLPCPVISISLPAPVAER